MVEDTYLVVVGPIEVEMPLLDMFGEQNSQLGESSEAGLERSWFLPNL